MALSTCCCCISLRTGSFVLTVIAAIFCLFSFVIAILSVHWEWIIYAGSGVIAHILCIYAIVKKKAVLMLPSLISLMIFAIFTVVYEIHMIVYYILIDRNVGPEKPEKDMKEVDFMFIMICIVFSLVPAISFYTWFVLFAQYKEFKSVSSGGGNNKNVV